jgi:hypothetical protein
VEPLNFAVLPWFSGDDDRRVIKQLDATGRCVRWWGPYVVADAQRRLRKMVAEAAT